VVVVGVGVGVPIEHVSLTVSRFPELSPPVARALSRTLTSPELGNWRPLLVTVTGKFPNLNSIITVPI
jgi:hypothetical protein